MRSAGPLMLAALLCGSARLDAAMGVRVVADPPGPAPVGTMITWSPELSGSFSSDLWYRFRVRAVGGQFRMVRDYGPVNSLRWTSIDEGPWEIELSVLDRASGEVATTSEAIGLTSRVLDGQPVISPTTHPLVYLYSGPPCGPGNARVRFEADGAAPQYTPYKPCVEGRSVNFYLAGLSISTSYTATMEVDRGRGGDPAAPTAGLTTDEISWDQPLPEPVLSTPTPGPEGVLLQSPIYEAPIATDLDGTLIWYGPPDLSILTNPGFGGTFWGISTSGTDPARDSVRQFDLVGMTLRETNAARVNEELAVLGLHPISGFHHEARPLADGKVVVLGAVERILTDVQGPGPVDVLGDMILVLDQDMQVVWAWDAFDHLDTSRRAVLGETCLAVVGCSAHYLMPDANDWTHGNSVAETADGALLYSARHQDWVIKIDYGGGEGSGDVIWRLGKDGDFQFQSDDPYPWFSHQHDVHPAAGAGSTIVLFDNGNTRVRQNPQETSRGQAIDLDETNRIATLRLNADLGVFSGALGSAQLLEEGEYHFNAGLVFGPTATAMGEAFSVQVDPAGHLVASLQLSGAVYRSFRLKDLYGPDPPKRGRRPIVVSRD